MAVTTLRNTTARPCLSCSALSSSLSHCALAAPALAQGNWPTSKPITYLVPFPPGGNTDTLARVISQPLNKALGTSVIIENKGGAGGSVGSALAARAPADGFTILGGVSNVFNETPPAVTLGQGEYSTVGGSVFASQYDYLGRRVFLNISTHF